MRIDTLEHGIPTTYNGQALNLLDPVRVIVAADLALDLERIDVRRCWIVDATGPRREQRYELFYADGSVGVYE